MRPAVEAYLAWLNEQGCELRDTVVVDMGWPVPTSSAQRWNAIGASIEPVHRMAFIQMQAQAHRDAARLPRMEFDDVEELAQLRKNAGVVSQHRDPGDETRWSEIADNVFRDALEGKIDANEARRRIFRATQKQLRAVVCGVCGVEVDISTLGVRDDGHVEEIVAALRAAWGRNYECSRDCGHPR